MSDNLLIYECDDCGWRGTDDDVEWFDYGDTGYSDEIAVCPNCGNDELYSEYIDEEN